MVYSELIKMSKKLCIVHIVCLKDGASRRSTEGQRGAAARANVPGQGQCRSFILNLN